MPPRRADVTSWASRGCRCTTTWGSSAACCSAVHYPGRWCSSRPSTSSPGPRCGCARSRATAAPSRPRRTSPTASAPERVRDEELAGRRPLAAGGSRSTAPSRSRRRRCGASPSASRRCGFRREALMPVYGLLGGDAGGDLRRRRGARCGRVRVDAGALAATGRGGARRARAGRRWACPCPASRCEVRDEDGRGAARAGGRPHLRARPVGDARLLRPARGDGARACATAGSTPATSASSATASCTSAAAPRTWSSSAAPTTRRRSSRSALDGVPGVRTGCAVALGFVPPRRRGRGAAAPGGDDAPRPGPDLTERIRGRGGRAHRDPPPHRRAARARHAAAHLERQAAARRGAGALDGAGPPPAGAGESAGAVAAMVRSTLALARSRADLRRVGGMTPASTSWWSAAARSGWPPRRAARKGSRWCCWSARPPPTRPAARASCRRAWRAGAAGARARIPPDPASPFRGIRYVQEDGTSVEGDSAGRRRAGHPAHRALARRCWTRRARPASRCGIAPACAPTRGARDAVCGDRRRELYGALLVAADGLASPLRHAAGLDAAGARRRRFGLRQHFLRPPWTDRVEVYLSGARRGLRHALGPSRVGVAFLWSEGALEASPSLPDCSASSPGWPPASPTRPPTRRRAAPDRCSARGPGRPTASCSSATPPATSTPSPARGCRWAWSAPRRWPRPCPASWSRKGGPRLRPLPPHRAARLPLLRLDRRGGARPRPSPPTPARGGAAARRPTARLRVAARQRGG